VLGLSQLTGYLHYHFSWKWRESGSSKIQSQEASVSLITFSQIVSLLTTCTVHFDPKSLSENEEMLKLFVERLGKLWSEVKKCIAHIIEGMPLKCGDYKD
jgi:hypothetical protein